MGRFTKLIREGDFIAKGQQIQDRDHIFATSTGKMQLKIYESKDSTVEYIDGFFISVLVF